MLAPVEVTVVVAVECTVYGPRTEPGWPAQVAGRDRESWAASGVDDRPLA